MKTDAVTRLLTSVSSRTRTGVGIYYTMGFFKCTVVKKRNIKLYKNIFTTCTCYSIEIITFILYLLLYDIPSAFKFDYKISSRSQFKLIIKTTLSLKSLRLTFACDKKVKNQWTSTNGKFPNMLWDSGIVIDNLNQRVMFNVSVHTWWLSTRLGNITPIKAAQSRVRGQETNQ